MNGNPYPLPPDSGSGLLSVGRVIDRNKPLKFTFDGKHMTGFLGDNLTSAIMAKGQRVLAHSFKYHRPRGLITMGSEEPNALVSTCTGSGGQHEPNLRATQVELFDGLAAVSQNRWPNLHFDVGMINNYVSRFIPSGFYYKTFKWPKTF